MKDIFKKYKAAFIITISIFTILLAVTILRFIVAEKSVNQAVNEKKQIFSESDINDASWNIQEIREKRKEIHWLEQQLILAKYDSLNLGINLTDSAILVQLKGTVLLNANILKQHPKHWIESPNFAAYHDITKISRIVEEQSTIKKRPIKKVQAPKNEEEAAKIKHDTIPDPLLVWQFVLDSKIEVIITGVGLGKDSLMNANYNSDILKYQVDRFKKSWLPKTYLPTLYIWLNDKDAKAIYRAIPEKGRVVFKI